MKRMVIMVIIFVYKRNESFHDVSEGYSDKRLKFHVSQNVKRLFTFRISTEMNERFKWRMLWIFWCLSTDF